MGRVKQKPKVNSDIAKHYYKKVIDPKTKEKVHNKHYDPMVEYLWNEKYADARKTGKPRKNYKGVAGSKTIVSKQQPLAFVKKKHLKKAARSYKVKLTDLEDKGVQRSIAKLNSRSSTIQAKETKRALHEADEKRLDRLSKQKKKEVKLMTVAALGAMERAKEAAAVESQFFTDNAKLSSQSDVLNSILLYKPGPIKSDVRFLLDYESERKEKSDVKKLKNTIIKLEAL